MPHTLIDTRYRVLGCTILFKLSIGFFNLNNAENIKKIKVAIRILCNFQSEYHLVYFSEKNNVHSVVHILPYFVILHYVSRLFISHLHIYVTDFYSHIVYSELHLFFSIYVSYKCDHISVGTYLILF